MHFRAWIIELQNYFYIGMIIGVVVFSGGCGSRQLYQSNKQPGTGNFNLPENIKYLSEIDPVYQLYVEGDTVWALGSGRIIKASISGSKIIETIDLNLSDEKKKMIKNLLVDSSGNVWVAGGNDLYKITGLNATPVDEIKVSFKDIKVLTEGSDGTIIVAGENKIATYSNENAWKIMEVPFTIMSAIAGSDEIVFLSRERGIVKMKGDTFTEYPHPLFKTKPYDKFQISPLSVVYNKKLLWVLWSGDVSYLSVLYPDDHWDVFTLQSSTGIIPSALWDAGDMVILQAEDGCFYIKESRKTSDGIKLQPVNSTLKAKKLIYRIESHDFFVQATKYADYKYSAFTPVPRPFIKLSGENEIESQENFVLEPLMIKPYSRITNIYGGGNFILAGTESTGIIRIKKGGYEVTQITSYSAKPFIPLSFVRTGEGEILYPLASGELGIFSGTPRGKLAISSNPGEKVAGLVSTSTSSYAISLIATEDRINIYKLTNYSFQKLMERNIDLTTGIGNIGGFSVAPDGTFWFTIKSFSEGQEMGAAELRPGLGEIIYNGAIPIPPQYALIIPNGVSSLKVKKDGTVFLGGMDGLVLIRPDRSIKKFQEYEGLVGDFVTDLAIDKNDRLWITTVEGLGYLENETISFPQNPPFRGTGTSCVGVDKEGRALIVDEDGLKVFEGGTFKLLLPRGSIRGSPVLDVEGDPAGNIWIVTEQGITIFKP